MDFTLTTEWKRYWVVYSQSSTTAVKHVICPRMGSVADQAAMSGTGTVSIKMVKLEEGGVPTPWIPNNTDANYVGNINGFSEESNKVSIGDGFIESSQFIEI